MKKIVIAIDGPASSGKSTVAKFLSKKLNILHLNTGSLYRVIALYCQNNNVDVYNESAVSQAINNCDIEIGFEDGFQKDYLNNVCVTEYLRTEYISKISSVVSQYKAVRKKVLDMQRNVALKNSVVMEGRDITSEVLPNADFKFFITASPEERARRRYEEDVLSGMQVDYQSVLKEIKERDYRDYNRTISPLKIVADAVVIDTTNLSIDEVVEKIENHIKKF